MKKLVKKDKKNRNCLFDAEIKRFILKNIMKNNNFSMILRLKALLKLSEELKKSSSIFFVNRCVFTGRRKRINKFYSFSRIMFLKLARFGYISGLKKASW
jgi:ribosomal protein S14